MVSYITEHVRNPAAVQGHVAAVAVAFAYPETFRQLVGQAGVLNKLMGVFNLSMTTVSSPQLRLALGWARSTAFRDDVGTPPVRATIWAAQVVAVAAATGVKPDDPMFGQWRLATIRLGKYLGIPDSISSLDWSELGSWLGVRLSDISSVSPIQLTTFWDAIYEANSPLVRDGQVLVRPANVRSWLADILPSTRLAHKMTWDDTAAKLLASRVRGL
jgi:hypothetical protein